MIEWESQEEWVTRVGNILLKGLQDMRPEEAIEKAVTEWCEEHGILARKWTCPGRRGVLDYLYWAKGKHCIIEYKVPGKELEPLQEIEFSLLEKAQVEVRVYYSFAGATGFLQRYFEL